MNKVIVVAFFTIVLFSACSEIPKNIREDVSTFPETNTISGSWATVRVSDSYQHVGCIMGEFEKGRRADAVKTSPWTYARHIFIDKTDPRDKLTKLLTVIIERPKYNDRYGRDVRFGSEDLNEEIGLGEKTFDGMDVIYKIKKDPFIKKGDIILLNKEGYKFVALNNAYKITFRKLCSPTMRVDTVFFQANSSPEQILENSKKAVTFSKQ